MRHRGTVLLCSQSTEVAGDTTTTSSYNYDPNGNQISKSIAIIKPEGDARSYSMGEATSSHIAFYDYDCYNRLTGVDTNGVVSTYTYAPDGLRLSKTVDGETTTFVYDGANIIEEVTPTDTKKYYRGIEIVKNDDNLYYIYNGQGDVAILSNAEGIAASYTFDAYGNADSTGEVYNPFGYRGEYQDLCSGLIYLRNRYYDTDTGRFISEDPAKAGLNWYVYCDNNPIKYIDPSGTVPVETIIDLASIGWSFSDFVSNPSWANFGFLAWDVAAALVPYAPGSYSAKTIKTGTQILSKSDNYVKSGVWAMKAFDRGYEIEKALGGMANNFPVIDKYVKSQYRAGIMWLSSVTSIKSIDITASSYKSGNTMKNLLKKYVDDLAAFKGKPYKDTYYQLESCGNKILEIAIPPVEMTSNQAKVFEEIKEYATEKGIELITRIVE